MDSKFPVYNCDDQKFDIESPNYNYIEQLLQKISFLLKMNLINCNSCHSLNIDKSIMSPRISTNLDPKNPKNQTRINEVKSKIQEFQSYIEFPKTFDTKFDILTGPPP